MYVRMYASPERPCSGGRRVGLDGGRERWRLLPRRCHAGRERPSDDERGQYRRLRNDSA